MKNVGIAFAVGGSIAAFLFVTVKFGVDMGFRAAAAMSRRRESQREKRNG